MSQNHTGPSEKVFNFKVVVVGDPAVGKSSLVRKFVDNNFSPHYDPTVGVDFKVRHVMKHGKVVKMSIWDNSGCAKFRSIISSYLRGAQGVVVMYDVTNVQSYLNLQGWLTDLTEQGILSGAAVCIIANKVDAKAERKVGRDEARNFAFSKGCQYMEVSALTGEGIEEAFESLSTFMIANLPDRPSGRKGAGAATRSNASRNPFVFFTARDGKAGEEATLLEDEEEGEVIEEGRGVSKTSRQLNIQAEQALARREHSWLGRWMCW